jgi:hypothetical protein
MLGTGELARFDRGPHLLDAVGHVPVEHCDQPGQFAGVAFGAFLDYAEVDFDRSFSPGHTASTLTAAGSGMFGRHERSVTALSVPYLAVCAIRSAMLSFRPFIGCNGAIKISSGQGGVR